MDARRLASIAALLAVLAVIGFLFVNTPYFYQVTDPSPSDYERATVTLADANGTDLATVEVRIADTDRKRWVGLSKTESLAPGEGMLFVHERETTHAYVMRDMSFPLDIVFVDANGTVTAIHHAPVPEDTSGSALRRYRGRGRYVLEVPRGYTNATGLDVGDEVEIPRGAT